MGTTITTSTETADVTTTEDPVPIVDYTPREIHGSEIALTSHHEGSQDRSARDVEDYPESEMDDMDWDDLELSPFKETITRNKQRDEKPSPSQNTLPHLGQDTRQRTSEGRQDKSTNHKTGGFLNSINGTHSVATNTTARTMQPSETSWIQKDPLLTTMLHHSYEEEGINIEDDYSDQEVDNLDWDV